MKKQVAQFLLGTLYTIIVAVLLVSHLGAINGWIQRTMAMVEILLLVVPLVVILGLYLRVKNKPEDITQNDNTQKKCGMEGNESLGIEKNFEQFVMFIDQYELSEREVEVAWLVYRGYTNRQIAEELFIAESTVKKHVSHIYEKIGVSGRKEFKGKMQEEREIRNKKEEGTC